MSDLLDFMRGLTRRHYIIGGASLLLTTAVMVGFYVESMVGFGPRQPTIIYAQSWDAGRTRETAITERRVETAAREEAEAEHRARVKEILQKLPLAPTEPDTRSFGKPRAAPASAE